MQTFSTTILNWLSPIEFSTPVIPSNQIDRTARANIATAEVYGATSEPVLRLITCGGRFDREVESYPLNLVVFAEHLGNHPQRSATA